MNILITVNNMSLVWGLFTVAKLTKTKTILVALLRLTWWAAAADRCRGPQVRRLGQGPPTQLPLIGYKSHC